MKNKIILFAVMAIGITTTAFAQTTIKPHLGVNMSDVSISNADATGKAGVLAGLSVAFGKKFYFEPGLQYVAKSTEIVSTNNPSLPKGNYDLKGLRVPLAVGLHLLGDEKSTITLHGFAGLSAFFIMNDNFDDVNINLNKTNWAVFAGAGVDFWKLFLDASYEWSLSELSSDADIGKTHTLYINAGFRFNL